MVCMYYLHLWSSMSQLARLAICHLHCMAMYYEHVSFTCLHNTLQHGQRMSAYLCFGCDVHVPYMCSVSVCRCLCMAVCTHWRSPWPSQLSAVSLTCCAISVYSQCLSHVPQPATNEISPLLSSLNSGLVCPLGFTQSLTFKGPNLVSPCPHKSGTHT